jgi:site-specific recombinase XerD
LAAIRAFFVFVAREDPARLPQCQTIRAIPAKRITPPTLPYLEEPELQTVLDAVPPAARNGLRDRALLLLLYNSGARVSEVVQLNLSDLRLDQAPQVQLLGKGRKPRSCPLWPETAAALRAYLAVRTPQDPQCERVFLNAQGTPLTRFGVRHVLRKHVASAQGRCASLTGKRVSPHTFRHTTAMHLLRSGNDIVLVSYWLGHASINTTHVYLEIDMEMKRQMLDKAPAPAVETASPWRKPGILDWLMRLAKAPHLCAVNRPANQDQPLASAK